MEKINHNPQDLKIGEKVVLDKAFRTHSIVEIIALSPQGMYATIKGGDDIWECMTNRLTRQ